MPRPPTSHLTLSKIQDLLAKRRQQIAELHRERTKLQRELKGIDVEITAISGGSGTALAMSKGGRPHNEKSLVQVIADVLTTAGKSLSVSEILAGVEQAGYRSSAANFRGLINQMLIRERKTFSNVARGTYRLVGDGGDGTTNAARTARDWRTS